jgi:NAD(P)-dependent dehydrogenase (short-subunit alcohol dehydrogenase family)
MLPPLVIGPNAASTAALGDAIGPVDFCPLPDLDSVAVSWNWQWGAELERWQKSNSYIQKHSGVVVVCWDGYCAPQLFLEIAAEDWLVNVERRMAIWFSAVQLAVQRCADSGSIVLVVERPAALDAAGHSSVVAAAEGMISMMRCVAAAEGKRGVRANVVTTELWTVPEHQVGPTPHLSSFPGSIGREVAGAVRFLLSSDAEGVTGSVLTPDGGRAL